MDGYVLGLQSYCSVWLSGIWHGAGWNFLLWGLLHALFLIVNRSFRRLRLPAFFVWSGTMIACFYAWLCFYETRTSVLLVKLKLLVTPSGYRGGAFHEALHLWSERNGIILLGILSLTAFTLLLEWMSVRRKSEPYFYLRRPAILVGLIILTVFLAPQQNNGFIYFAFLKMPMATVKLLATAILAWAAPHFTRFD